jgi:hypothetical protein
MELNIRNPLPSSKNYESGGNILKMIKNLRINKKK